MTWCYFRITSYNVCYTKLLRFGKEGEWDQNATHDPHPIVFNGKIYIYYKAAYNKWPNKRDKYAVAHGLVIAQDPLGPFKKHPLNPVMQSGHETCYFPYKDGVAVITSYSIHYTKLYEVS